MNERVLILIKLIPELLRKLPGNYKVFQGTCQRNYMEIQETIQGTVCSGSGSKWNFGKSNKFKLKNILKKGLNKKSKLIRLSGIQKF